MTEKDKLYFCTLFDSNYLSRGITMYESLKVCCKNFQLFVIAFDDACFSVLKSLNYPNITIIALNDLEDEELLNIKSGRTRAEYCWTCTSSTILYCIEKYGLPSCTYLDADLFFYEDPSILLDEMGEKSILITEHRYTPKYNKTKESGIYCVQFVTFKNDQYGMKALNWWRNACINWCYARYEDGKFGDQKYLDDWTTRFEKVHVLNHLGGGLALWNIQQYNLSPSGQYFSCIEKTTGRTFVPVFYHFHYIKYFKNGLVELGRREISEEVKNYIYIPYLRKMEATIEIIAKVNPIINAHGSITYPIDLKMKLINLYRKITGVYHMYNLKKLIRNS